LKHGVKHGRLWIEVDDAFGKRLAGGTGRYAVDGPLS
jgi:hypothetical protein